MQVQQLPQHPSVWEACWLCQLSLEFGAVRSAANNVSKRSHVPDKHLQILLMPFWLADHLVALGNIILNSPAVDGAGKICSLGNPGEVHQTRENPCQMTLLSRKLGLHGHEFK